MRTLSFALILLLAACASGGGGSAGGGTTGSAGAPPGRAHEPGKAAEPEVSGASAGAAPAAGAAGTGTVLVAQTSEERRAAINKQLDDSLGSFDERLHQEQQQLAQERDARRTAASAAAAPEGADPGADAPVGTAATESSGVPAPYGGHHSKGRDHSGDLKSEKTGKVGDDNAGNGAVAREVPDGSDDDVVARRLRQAAQQETDPELKEKLWQEYADYKKNAQGK